MSIEDLNSLSHANAFNELFKCCGSKSWAKQLTDKRPFRNKKELLGNSSAIWESCTKADGLEAFTHHPKIGDSKSLEKKFASTKEWAGGEQAGVNAANEKTLQELAKGNREYENKFGFIFIVCATGKTAGEMLVLLNARMKNNTETEIKIAMKEQNKITLLRLQKLIQ